jgi:UDP-N-acetylmuramoyl-tripeptide--D-alanyl-D-alanine ligase
MSGRTLWTVEAMTAAVGGQPQGPLPAAVPGLSIDTRTIAPGEAFLANTGDARDGHVFVGAA